MERKVKLCLQMSLRDYAAFEDLAEELGVEVTEVEVVKQAASTTRKRHSRIQVTDEMVEAIKEYPESMSNVSVRRNLKKVFDKVPALSTISGIRTGSRERRLKR